MDKIASCHIAIFGIGDVGGYTAVYTPENADEFELSQYDYIVDAVDTVSAKLALAENAQKAGVPIISCMGAGNKLDPIQKEPVTFAVRSPAVTARLCSFPERELKEAIAFCKSEGIRHFIVDSEELEIENFSNNPPNRCYLCKRELFEKIRNIAEKDGVKSPLRFAGFIKKDIRALSKALGLPTWNKQSFACLSSRFVYGEKISREKLSMVDKAEQLLLDLGFHQVRVRIHNNIARVEIEPALLGYRTGSMN